MKQMTGGAPLCTTLLLLTWTESKRALRHSCFLSVLLNHCHFSLFMVLCCLSQKNDPTSTGISLRCMHSSTVSCSDWKPNPQMMWLHGLPLKECTVLQPPCPTELFSQCYVLCFPLCGFLTRLSSENFLHLLCKSI